MAEEGHTSLYAFCLGGVGAHQVAAPVEGPGSGRSGGKAGGLLPRKTQDGRGTQRRGGSCSPPGGAVEVEPFSGHCGWGFPGTSLRKSGLQEGPGHHHSGVEHALAGKLAAKLGSTERGVGGGGGATCREPALGVL